MNVMGGYIWWLLYIACPVVLLPGYGVFETGVIPCLSLIITSCWLAYYSVSHKDNFLGVMFWVFVYVFMVMAPAAQAIGGGYPWYDSYLPSDIFYAEILVLIGLVCVSLGNIGRSSLVISNKYIEINNKRLHQLILASMVMSVVCIFLLGGISSLFISRSEQFSLITSGTSQLMMLQGLMRVPLYLVSLIKLVHMCESIKSARWNVGGVSLTLFLLVLVVAINNPISTPRFWFGCVVLSYAFIVIKYFFDGFKKMLAPGLIFAVLVVFPLSDVFRRSVDVDVFAAIKNFELHEEIGRSPDFDAFQQLINTVIVVDESNHGLGVHTLGSLLFWVPRSIWPEKPVSTGEYVADQLHYNFLNLSCPLWAEMYFDFGMFGMGIAFFLYGRLIRFSSRDNMGFLIVVFMFFSAYQPYFLRGSLMVASNFLILFLVFYWYLIGGKKNEQM